MIEKKLVEKEVEVTVTEKRLVEKEFEVTVTEKRVVELFTYEGDEYTKDDLAKKLMRQATHSCFLYLHGVSSEEDDRTRRERGDRLCRTLFEDWMHKLWHSQWKTGSKIDLLDDMRQLYKILHEKMILIESLDELEKQ